MIRLSKNECGNEGTLSGETHHPSAVGPLGIIRPFRQERQADTTSRRGRGNANLETWDITLMLTFLLLKPPMHGKGCLI